MDPRSAGTATDGPPLIELHAGDLVAVDLGVPIGSEAGFVRPAVIVSAAGFLRPSLRTLIVVPCSTHQRGAPSHVALVPDPLNGLTAATWAQVEHIRSIGRTRCVDRVGNVGAVALAQMREIIALLVGLD